jgi:hypothetical protein
MLKTVILTKNEKQAAKVGIFIGFEGKKFPALNRIFIQFVLVS